MERTAAREVGTSSRTKVSGREAARIAFAMLCEEKKFEPAIRLAERILWNEQYVNLGLSDIDWEIDTALRKVCGDDAVKTNAVGYFAKFYINKEYEIDAELREKYA